VSGVKEKVLAAQRAGVKCVVFPAKNMADLTKIPDDIKKDLKIVLADELAEVVDNVIK
jgi:ATP-dependent Lon protease